MAETGETVGNKRVEEVEEPEKKGGQEEHGVIDTGTVQHLSWNRHSASYLHWRSAKNATIGSWETFQKKHCPLPSMCGQFTNHLSRLGSRSNTPNMPPMRRKMRGGQPPEMPVLTTSIAICGYYYYIVCSNAMSSVGGFRTHLVSWSRGGPWLHPRCSIIDAPSR